MKNTGFTLIEIVVALGAFSVVSVAAVWLVFDSLSLRDKALATITSQESLRVFASSLNQAVRSSTSVSGSGSSLFTSSPTDCWSFIYNPADQSLRYDHTVSPGCTPLVSPVSHFFPSNTRVTALNFTLNQLATGGRSVVAQGTLSITFPLDSYVTDFNETVTNLLD